MTSIETLLHNKQAIIAKTPRIRKRDLAAQLGISEAELLTLSPYSTVIRLSGDWKLLLPEIKRMGYVMALTRNEACVHERKGVYDNINFYGGPANMGVAVNPDIDLRFFMNEWVHALAVTMDRGKMGMLYSFQFFNGEGEAVHKVFSTEKSDIDVYHQLVAEYRAEDQSPLFPLPKKEETSTQKAMEKDIDVEAFQQEWLNLKDTHDFFGLLRKYGLGRTRALELAPLGHSQDVPVDFLKKVLQYCAAQAIPIMCFVHSKGCVQIHTGEVNELKELGQWYNILDPAFNLHLNMKMVKKAWIVKKPTVDGIVTSLELFDEDGELIVYFFGARKPGKPELEAWREAINQYSLSS